MSIWRWMEWKRGGWMGAVLLAMAPWVTASRSESVPASVTADATAYARAYDNEYSVTRGIQEAIDSLPGCDRTGHSANWLPTGGLVSLPAGVHVLHAPLVLKPDTHLRGTGRGTILQRPPALFVPLAEDIPAGSEQDYVVVADVSALRPGMWMAVGDRAGFAGEGPIVRIEGRRVYLKGSDSRSGGWHALQRAGSWRSAVEVLMERGGGLYNAYRLVLMAAGCTVSDLTIDGNKDAQEIDGEPLYKFYPGWWERQRSVPMTRDGMLARCLVKDAAGVAVNVGQAYVTIRDNEISGSYQGIHPGAGPFVTIVENRIHGHERHGIGACLGNRGMIISRNIVYDNGEEGIGWFGVSPAGRNAYHGDFHSIISENVVFRNGWAGIGSGQGEHGPYDFIITGNLVMDNWQHSCPHPRITAMMHLVPAGIALHNSKRCIVTNNRVFDGQDTYSARLAEPAEAGSTEVRINLDGDPHWWYTLPMLGWMRGVNAPVYKGRRFREFQAWLDDGTRRERVRVVRETGRGQWALAEPLQQEFPIGAELRAEKTQAWGIYLGGEASEGNIIAMNQVEGNRVGGILWEGPRAEVSGNVGSARRINPEKSLRDNVYPEEDSAEWLLERRLIVPRMAAQGDILPEWPWLHAAVADGFLQNGTSARPATRVGLAYDHQTLHIRFECDDPKPSRITLQAGADTEVFRGDAVAILLQPDPESAIYFQFALGAGGIRFSQRSDGRRRDHEGYAPEWKSKVNVTESGWNAQAAVPFTALGITPPASGAVWRMNFGRVFRGHEISSWSPPSNWHDPETYGRAVFGE